ncbi:MAG: nicotinamide mononucleotide transporter [Sphingobacteriales bacterium]|nr:nicotinamide mononucleotide transporter [Sphingobacteriales bacterium]
MFETLWQQIVQSSALEAIAVIFGLLSVYFSGRNHIAVYPTGIVNVLLYVYICFNSKLYADMGIQMYYFVMSVYGWIHWNQVQQNEQSGIMHNSSRENLRDAGLFFLFFGLIYALLRHYTDSDVPFWDSLTTAIFLVAMYLMARKKIEHWLWWIAGDIMVIPLFIYKGLVLTAFQYVVFTALAIYGFWQWKQQIASPRKK